MFDNMGLVSGFLFLSLLWVCSGGLWKILDSIIYRVTKNEKKYGMVGASFIASMAVVVLILVSSNPGLISPHHTLSEWPFMTLVYCCTAAAIVFVVSMFGLLDFVFGRLMDAIRGER
jgi:ABC-type branched-subunit amino acid transport system permease subunit